MLKRERAAVAGIARMSAAILARLLPAQVQLEAGTLDERGVVRIDPRALEQILATLCTHPRIAMPAGGTIRIECRNTFLDSGHLLSNPWVVPGAYACVSLSAIGVARDAATRQSASEPIPTTSEAHLAQPDVPMLCALIEEQGGMVHFSSVAGHGCVTRLYFPLADGASAER